MTKRVLKKRVEQAELKIKQVEALIGQTKISINESQRITLRAAHEQLKKLYMKIQNAFDSEETIRLVNEYCQRQEYIADSLSMELGLI
ncbi:MAG: hypothetical protein KBF45_11810 [Cyclobacteriaceae bacterium]|jgi:hypothetical protein|nr:hypothetical protein [Cyclobacteriaceae bacterium]